MIGITDQRGLILLIRCKGQRWYHLACFGRKRHYRKDGSCKHTDDVLARVKPKFKPLVKVQPFGGKSAVQSAKQQIDAAESGEGK